MSETIKNLISRRELLEDIENYNRTPDKSLLPGIFLKAGQYLEQKNMRRLQLKTVFNAKCSLSQALDALDTLPSPEIYFLSGCFLLAVSRERSWNVSEIIAKMQRNCSGCISRLSEEQKDFAGRIALAQASKFLTEEQLVQVILLLDGYYLKQDILNRIAACDEPEKLSILRKRFHRGNSSACSEDSNIYKNLNVAEAFVRFEQEMIFQEPAPGCVLPEAPALRDITPTPELLKLFELLKKENLKSGKAVMQLLTEIGNPSNTFFSGYKNNSQLQEIAPVMYHYSHAGDVWLSFAEYAPECFDNWFEEAWDVLCRIGKDETFTNHEEQLDWHRRNLESGTRTVRLECYLVKFLRLAIQHGTFKQISRILSFLSPGVMARHISRLAGVDIPQLYLILKENGFSPFALHTVISSLDWSQLPLEELFKIAPCMVDDKKFMTVFLERMNRYE